MSPDDPRPIPVARVAFCLLLPAVPVGTAIGVVGLVLLSRGKEMGRSQA